MSRFGFSTPSTPPPAESVSNLSDDELDRLSNLVNNERTKRSTRTSIPGRVTETIELPPPRSRYTSEVIETDVVEQPLTTTEDILVDEEVHTNSYVVQTYQRVIPRPQQVTKRQYEKATVIEPPPQVIRTRTVAPTQYVMPQVVQQSFPVTEAATYAVAAPVQNNQVTTTTRRVIYPNGLNAM